MYVIESRMAADNCYVCHGGRKARGTHAPHSVLVRGARGKASARSGLSAEDYAWLKDEPTFKTHVKNGSLIVHPPAAAIEKKPTTSGLTESPSVAMTQGESGEGTENDAGTVLPTEGTGEKVTAKEAAKPSAKDGSGKKAK